MRQRPLIYATAIPGRLVHRPGVAITEQRLPARNDAGFRDELSDLNGILRRPNKGTLSMATSGRLMLGRTLGPEVAQLLDDVEQMYGGPVVFKAWEGATISEGGNCTVDEDGVPEVTINLNHPQWEDAVVHELQHLILRKKQYPFFWLQNDVGMGFNMKAMHQSFFELYEPILHFVFNPAIRRMGRNPADLFNPMFRQSLEPKQMEKNIVNIAWPLIYARILLECDEPDLREQLRERCERLGWSKAMEKAKRIAAKVEAMEEEPSPQTVVQVLIDCANFVFEGIYEFSAVEMVEVRKGDQVEQKVIISVSLPE
jgi:hypothetical protein